jgi:hypothetical protein
MRSQSIKAQSRSETSLNVLLIKTNRLRPDMTLMPRILVSVVRAALGGRLFFLQRCSRSETPIDPIPRRRRANATPFAKERFDAFLTPVSTAVQGDTKGRGER